MLMTLQIEWLKLKRTKILAIATFLPLFAVLQGVMFVTGNEGVSGLELKNENLADILRETIIDILNNPKYENADIIFEPEIEDITLNCDSTALQRAFTNIIYNALVHNTDNTKVWVRLSSNEDITVEIEDNGKGIPAEEVNKLFDRYYRGTNTGELHKGSGLGMAISKQIIESHGGKIIVDSKLGVGTVVKIILPSSNT
jgi:signal transduction histidine kinase